MYQIILKGLASNESVNIPWDELDYNIQEMSLLDFLLSNARPIAYNCYGEGVCKKCTLRINGVEYLSCQITMKDLNNGAIIEVGYL